MTSRSRAARPGQGRGSSSGRQQRIAQEHLLEGDDHGEGTGQEVAVGDAVVALPQPLEDGHHVLVLGHEPGVGGGQVVDRPQRAGQLARRARAADLQVVGAGEGEVRRSRRARLAMRPHLVLPRVGRDVETVVDGRAAGVEEAVAQAVAGRRAVLGDGEGGQVPAAVPALAPAVLAVGQLVALERAEPQVVAERRGAERGAAAGALADEDALGDQAAEARADLLVGLPAGVGDVVELGGVDGCRRPGPCRTPTPWSEPRRP